MSEPPESGDRRGYMRRSAPYSVMAAASTAIFLFLVLRFINDIAGLEWLGVWSLIQGLMLVGRIVDSGAGANITREIAVSANEGDAYRVRAVVLAGLVVSALPGCVLSAIMALPIGYFVATLFGSVVDTTAIWVLVGLALVNACLSATSNVILAALEGFFQLRTRSLIVIGANVVPALAAGFLILHLGPAGIGWSYVFQSALLTVGSSIAVGRMLRNAPRAEAASVLTELRGLWRNNLRLSGVAIIRLMFEPLTKAALSLTASLAVLAVFEVALRVSTQVRVLVQSGVQPLLALGARRPSGATGGIELMFRSVSSKLSAVNGAGVGLQIVAAPLLAWFALGDSSSVLFYVLFGMLVASNAINIAGLPGYMYQLAGGDLTPLVRLQLLMGTINLAGALASVASSQAYPVLISYALAFAIGGIGSRLLLPGSFSAREVALGWVLPPTICAVLSTIWVAALQHALTHLPILSALSLAACGVVLIVLGLIWRFRR